MSQGSRLDSEAHRRRAAEHERVGNALADASHEWAAVCYFYAAYHIVKAALLDDPIFDAVDTCQAKHPDLMPEDRYVSRHKGRRNTSAGREWGVNELVLQLYRAAAGDYDKLHQASNDVRYHDGLTGTVQDIRNLFERFKGKVERGILSTEIVP